MGQKIQSGEEGDLYRRLVDSVSSSALFMLDLDGRIISWNRAAVGLTGYAADEIIGLKLLSLFHGANMNNAWNEDIRALVIEAGSVSGENWCIRKGGSRFWCGYSLDRVDDDHGEMIGFAGTMRDLTGRKAYEDALRTSEAKFRSVIDNSPVGLALVGTDGRWLEVNRALSDLLGYSPEELVQTTFQELTHADDLEIDLHLVNDVLAGKRTTYRMEKRYIRKDGSIVWGLLSVSLIRDADGDPAYFISQIQDMTDVREIQRELEYKALHDPLTGLANRRKFQIVLGDAIASARRSGTEHSLCFIDLDGFKAVNDTAGHEVGDRLLAAVSAELEKAVRSGDLVARFGGDEFGIILFDCPTSVSQDILTRLCNSVAAMNFCWEGRAFRITASIGIAAIAPDTRSAKDVLRRADMACYDVKRAGRNAVRVHGVDMISNVVRLTPSDERLIA